VNNDNSIRLSVRLVEVGKTWAWVMVRNTRQISAASGLGGALLVSLLMVASVNAQANSPLVPDAEGLFNAERELFTTALRQLEDSDQEGFSESLAQLQQYPLRDYLVFQQLQRDWDSREPERSDVGLLNAFEKSTKHESLTRRLTRSLQQRIADTEQWKLFLGISKSRHAGTMPCTTVRALHETGQLKRWNDTALQLWVKPEKHPELCADVLQKLEEKQTPPVAAIWQKINLSMERNRPAYAESMLGYLATPDRKRVKRWIEAHKKPESLLKSGELSENSVVNRRIIADLLVDWSREDTKAAVEHWLSIRDNYTFFEERYFDTHHSLVMRAAYKGMPEAQAWLEGTTTRGENLELQEWRVRLALRAQDWPAVLANVARLPAQEQEEDHWAYWVARALEQQGERDQAMEIYTELALLQSYYGFLSADRLSVDYSIYDEPITPENDLLARLTKDPALVRAREFYYVDLQNESRREWNNWMQRKEPEEIAASAVLANVWQLHDRAIFAAGRSDSRRAITLRFPVLYRREVAEASLENRIDPAWVYGVMRRESAYIRDVRSGSGAVGLMQLMPRTASYVAKLQGQNNWAGDLTDAKTNIGFGTYYLRYVMDKFDNHQVLATASYNAGPHRVNQWLREAEIDADVWIDTIPFTETRRYVRAVMAYAAIYEHHLTGQARRLTSKLTTIPADPDV